MIKLELEEPNVEYQYCNICGKRKRLKATLIHWPSAEYKGISVTLISGEKIGPFSFWYYECAWCRAIWTKKKKRWG